MDLAVLTRRRVKAGDVRGAETSCGSPPGKGGATA